MIVFLLSLVNGALQAELDRFFEILNGASVGTRVVTKAAFSLARRKFHFGAFREINRVVVEAFYANQVGRRWKGLRLLAIDGSTALLPRTQEMMEWFGVVDQNVESPRAIGRVSALYDVLNRMVIDAQLAPYRLGERELAAMHLPMVRENDLLLFDRGYPAFWLVSLLRTIGVHFCMRTEGAYGSAIAEFAQSGEAERVIELRIGSAARSECRRKGVSLDPVRVRLVRVELSTGQTEILMTSLLDQQEYAHSIFAELYHQRWGIEEGYKFLKCRVEIENFSGKSVHAVMQEFHAKIVTGNLTALNAYQAQAEITEVPGRKPVRVNFSYAIASMKTTIVRLLTAANPVPALIAYLDRLRCTVEIVRPQRSFKRRIAKVLPPRFRMGYKRCG